MLPSVKIDQSENAFDRDGFVLFRGLLADAPELKRLQEAILKTVELRANRAPNTRTPRPVDRLSNDRVLIDLFRDNPKNVSFVYDVLRYAPELSNLLNSEPLLREVGNVFGGPSALVVANNLNLRVDMPGQDWTENLPWHQDWPYNNPLYLFKNSIAAWIAVFDVPIEVGPMVLKVGSQEVGEIQPEKVPHKGKQDRQDHFVYQVPDSISCNPKFPEVQPALKAGDLILFDLTLVHKSGINVSADMIRWSAQARYHDARHPSFLSKYSYT